jgi:hypothetical protein
METKITARRKDPHSPHQRKDGMETALHRFCEQWSIKMQEISGRSRLLRINGRPDPYSLQANSATESTGKINAIRLTQCGRFSNNLIQTINAIFIAKTLDIKYLVAFEGIFYESILPISINGLTILRSDSSKTPAPVLSGGFYRPNGSLISLFATAKISDGQQIVRDFIYPLYAQFHEVDDSRHDDDALYIHIRSGDVFEGKNVHREYVQPPLAYYKKVIQHAIDVLSVSRFVIVFEDEKNPCISALRSYMDDHSLSYRLQSGTYFEDIQTLVFSKHLCIGFGSFSEAICLLSSRVENVYCFNDIGRLPVKFDGGVDYTKFSPRKFNVYKVVDKARQYIRHGDWRNHPAQRRMMIDYPIGNLEFVGDLDRYAADGTATPWLVNPSTTGQVAIALSFLHWRARSKLYVIQRYVAAGITASSRRIRGWARGRSGLDATP